MPHFHQMAHNRFINIPHQITNFDIITNYLKATHLLDNPKEGVEQILNFIQRDLNKPMKNSEQAILFLALTEFPESQQSLEMQK